jgi:protein-tyrosine-phosphatase
MRIIACIVCVGLAGTGIGCGDRAANEQTVEPVVEEVSVEIRDVVINPELESYVDERVAEFGEIPQQRRTELEAIATFVSAKHAAGEPVKLTFICTHNSRRSHMSQIWAQTGAYLFGFDDVETFSGGTEATAFNPRAVAAMQRAGFLVEPFSDGKNPVYEVRYEPEMEPMQAFSKVYDDAPNPTEGFAAIMTCSAADDACPIVFGAAERIAIPYDDPKAFDGTEREAEAYDERCRQIAREMLYVFATASKG